MTKIKLVVTKPSYAYISTYNRGDSVMIEVYKILSNKYNANVNLLPYLKRQKKQRTHLEVG